MESINSKWPSKSELESLDLNDSDAVSLAPIGVLTQYSEAVYQAYDKKILGIIAARYKHKENGDKTEFTYSLYLTKIQEKEEAQIKILEMDVEDDGWYPAVVHLIGVKGKEKIGRAETEKQLRKYIEIAINTNQVKAQIKTLLS